MLTAAECIVECNTFKSCILLASRCSLIMVFSNSSCSSFEWNRVKTLYCSHIWSSSGERYFSKGLGQSKFLSSIKSFLRFRSSNLSRNFHTCISDMEENKRKIESKYTLKDTGLWQYKDMCVAYNSKKCYSDRCRVNSESGNPREKLKTSLDANNLEIYIIFSRTIFRWLIFFSFVGKNNKPFYLTII